MVGVRKLMDCYFTKEEMRMLDDILPSGRRSQHLDAEDEKKKVDLPKNITFHFLTFALAFLG